MASHMQQETALDFAFSKIDVDLGFIMTCFREVLDKYVRWF